MISAQQKKKKKIRKTFLETFVSDTDEADSDEDGLEKDVHDDDFLNASMIMNEQQLQQQQQMNIGQSNTSQHKRVRTGSYLPSFVPVKMSTDDVLKAVGDGDKELLLAEEDVRGGDFEKGLNKESALKTEETISLMIFTKGEQRKRLKYSVRMFMENMEVLVMTTMNVFCRFNRITLF